MEKTALNAQTANEYDFCDVGHYLYLFLLLYAEDTPICAETASDMQKADAYCKKIVFN